MQINSIEGLHEFTEPSIAMVTFPYKWLVYFTSLKLHQKEPTKEVHNERWMITLFWTKTY